MATQPRPSHSSSDQSPLDLLQSLLDAPPAPSGARLGPVVLRSAAEQRRYALSRYPLRTWFDRALFYAERLLLLATVAFFGMFAWMAWIAVASVVLLVSPVEDR